MNHMQSSPHPQQNPILLQLYHQGLQLGLPREQAVRILNIGQIQRTPNAYGARALGSPGAAPTPYRSSATPYGSSPYHRVPSNNLDYPQMAGLQISEQYDPFAVPQQGPPPTPQIVRGGTTYYPDPNQPSQPGLQYGNNMSAEPTYGAGQSYSHEYDNSAPLHPIPETTEGEHRYSHESYLPETYAGEAYGHDAYKNNPAHRSGP
jgi:hypothetical protein